MTPESGHPLVLSPAPHLHDGSSVERIFLETTVAMGPLLLASAGFFGAAFLKSAAACLLGAHLAARLARRVTPGARPLFDPPGLVTALVLALTLPVGIPFALALLGGFLAVAAGRDLFGGVGRNIFNPAMFGYACLALAFPLETVGGALPVAPFGSGWFDLSRPSTGATPLASPGGGLLELVFGLKVGAPGECSSLMVLIGGAYLLARRVVPWHAPAGVAAGALLASALFAFPHLSPAAVLAPLFKGGLLFGAFFVATDPVTLPVRPRMRLLAGFLIGCLTIVLRLHTNLPEGVAFATLAVNALTPFLDSPVHGVHR